MRSRISHNGDDCGVCSSLSSPNKSRIAGNAMLWGEGGVIRNSHQISGSSRSAVRIHGLAKPSKPNSSMR